MIPQLKRFLDEKFDNIDSFIEDHMDEMDSNKKFRERVCGRIRMWTMFASLIGDDDILVGDFFKAAREVGMSGVMELRCKLSGETLDIIADDSPERDIPGKRQLREKSLITIKEITEMFDAEVVKVS